MNITTETDHNICIDNNIDKNQQQYDNSNVESIHQNSIDFTKLTTGIQFNYNDDNNATDSHINLKASTLGSSHYARSALSYDDSLLLEHNEILLPTHLIPFDQQHHEDKNEQQHQNQTKQLSTSSSSPSSSSLPSTLLPYCDTCEIEFNVIHNYDIHCRRHFKCQYDNCDFYGIKKVLIYHQRLIHSNMYTGESGLKVVNIQNKAFRILLGTLPGEVNEWRKARKENYPTLSSSILINNNNNSNNNSNNINNVNNNSSSSSSRNYDNNDNNNADEKITKKKKKKSKTSKKTVITCASSIDGDNIVVDSTSIMDIDVNLITVCNTNDDDNYLKSDDMDVFDSIDHYHNYDDDNDDDDVEDNNGEDIEQVVSSSSSSSPYLLPYCDTCEKEFVLFKSYDQHCLKHVKCPNSNCTYEASPQLLAKHIQDVHDNDNSGWKEITIEGKKLRILLGTSPDEVNEWRNERKSKFPTTAMVLLKKKEQQKLLEGRKSNNYLDVNNYKDSMKIFKKRQRKENKMKMKMKNNCATIDDTDINDFNNTGLGEINEMEVVVSKQIHLEDDDNDGDNIFNYGDHGCNGQDVDFNNNVVLNIDGDIDDNEVSKRSKISLQMLLDDGIVDENQVIFECLRCLIENNMVLSTDISSSSSSKVTTIIDEKKRKMMMIELKKYENNNNNNWDDMKGNSNNLDVLSSDNTFRSIHDNSMDINYNYNDINDDKEEFTSWYCDSCDKDYDEFEAYYHHCKSHVKCTFESCQFQASKNVITYHHIPNVHDIDTDYNSSGWKEITIEGKKLRILIGTSPDEVNEWRNERKSKFPTTAMVLLKKEEQQKLLEASHSKRKKVSQKRKRNNGIDLNDGIDHDDNSNGAVHVGDGSGDIINSTTNKDSLLLYCETCEKDFYHEHAYHHHCLLHQKCSYINCSFESSQAMMIKHVKMFHEMLNHNYSSNSSSSSSGGSGSSSSSSSESGWKEIVLDGHRNKMFRILLGTLPDEVNEWRKARKDNYPTLSSSTVSNSSSSNADDKITKKKKKNSKQSKNSIDVKQVSFSIDQNLYLINNNDVNMSSDIIDNNKIDANAKDINVNNVVYSDDTQITSSSSLMPYCDTCEKDFVLLSSYNHHCLRHVKCPNSNCTYEASPQLLAKHIQDVHDNDNSGWKEITIEGKKLRILLGTSPDEVNEWRNERKSKFPTTAMVLLKKEEQQKLLEAGDRKKSNKKNKKTTKTHVIVTTMDDINIQDYDDDHVEKHMLSESRNVNDIDSTLVAQNDYGNQHASSSSSSSYLMPYCDTCEKEFALFSSYNAHCLAHKSCSYPNCTFKASQQALCHHTEYVHMMMVISFDDGENSRSGENNNLNDNNDKNNGWKEITIEGKKLRILIGTSPNEVNEWRNERKSKFPTTAMVLLKKEEQQKLLERQQLEKQLKRKLKINKEKSGKYEQKYRKIFRSKKKTKIGK